MWDDIRDRLLSKAVIDPDTGCWLWTASLGAGGYGQLTHRRPGEKRRTLRPHRLAYEMFIGPIPADKPQLDHLCRVRRCINPWHLEPVTNRENTIRGLAPAVNKTLQLAKTHCKNNHPFSESNTLYSSSGRRTCRACAREKTRKFDGHTATPQRRRGRLVLVQEWVTANEAVGECGHRIATTHGRRTRSVICGDCATFFESPAGEVA